MQNIPSRNATIDLSSSVASDFTSIFPWISEEWRKTGEVVMLFALKRSLFMSFSFYVVLWTFSSSKQRPGDVGISFKQKLLFIENSLCVAAVIQVWLLLSTVEFIPFKGEGYIEVETI